MTKSVLLSGASGLVGARAAALLCREGWQVRALSRSGRRAEAAGAEAGAPGEQRWFRWDGTNPPEEALRGVGAVVHLAGEPIFGGLPTAARRERMAASRIDSTRALVEAIGALAEAERPQTLVCASAVGFYGDRGEDLLTEKAAPGDGFLADLCVAWEQAAAAAERHGVRVVSLRIGIVLARGAGALPMMAMPFRFGVGGKLGDGRQWVPWIHVDDLARLIELALDPESGLRGIVNAVSPEPVRNEELTRAIAERLGRPAFFTVPAFAIRGVLGELASELLGSHRVVPEAAQRIGFEFQYADLEAAVADTLS